MLSAERRHIIADLIRRQVTLRVQDLCQRFEASESTIRRDLAYLEERGILRRTYGGAVSAAEGPVEEDAIDTLTPSQTRIGAAAARVIAPGETVFIGPGAIALAVAQQIADKPGVTVVTNALHVAVFLAERARTPVILTGGQIERRGAALWGHVADLTLRELRADRAVIGVHGIHISDGLTADSLAGAQLLRTVIGLISTITIVADTPCWGRVGPAFLAPLDAADTIVTDLSAPSAMVWDITELGIKVIQS